MTRLRWLVGALALGLIGLSLWQLGQSAQGLVRTEMSVAGTPVTVLRATDAPPGPAVVIAHGFAGSRPLMLSFAQTLARNGYVAVSFDFLGHGRNPQPLTGDVTTEEGATQALLAELGRIVDFAVALPEADGRIALLGHSMASDIVVRQAVADGRIGATVAVSMFSRAVTQDRPRNLLMITGEWEGFLRREAEAAIALAAGAPVPEGVTHGDLAAGTGRRAAVAPGTEHVGVLYSRRSMAEALGWLDAGFGRRSAGHLAVRGPWIVLLLCGIVALGWPMAGLLPRLSGPPAGRGRGWRRVLAISGLAAIGTPLLLAPLPTGFLPVLVADYLAVHFAAYGALVGLGLVLWGERPGWPGWRRVLAILGLAAAVAAFWLGGLGLALDTHVAAFWPHGPRWPVIGALLIGILPYMLTDEWLSRGAGAPRWAYAVTKLAFLVSLAIAVALDLEALFFLIIILPVILVFFLIFGLASGWVCRRTGVPAVAGIANAAVFAWALGVTFPMLGG